MYLKAIIAEFNVLCNETYYKTSNHILCVTYMTSDDMIKKLK